jgi:hypothetical protein
LVSVCVKVMTCTTKWKSQGMTLDLPDCGNEVFPSFAERHLLSPSSDGRHFTTGEREAQVKNHSW